MFKKRTIIITILSVTLLFGLTQFPIFQKAKFYVSLMMLTISRSMGPKISVPIHIKGLKNKNELIRGVSALGLIDIGASSQVAAPDLIIALKDNDKSVRSASAYAIGKIGINSRSAIQSLINSLSDKECSVSCSASNALTKIASNDESVILALVEQLKDREERNSCRKCAVRSLANMGGNTTPLLIEALNNEDENIRFGIISTLGYIGPDAKDALPALRSALASETAPDFREAIIEVIDKIEGKE